MLRIYILYTCIWLHMCKYMYVYMYIWIYMYIYTYSHIYMYIYMYIYTYNDIYINIYIHMFIGTCHQGNQRGCMVHINCLFDSCLLGPVTNKDSQQWACLQKRRNCWSNRRITKRVQGSLERIQGSFERDATPDRTDVSPRINVCVCVCVCVSMCKSCSESWLDKGPEE